MGAFLWGLEESGEYFDAFIVIRGFEFSKYQKLLLHAPGPLNHMLKFVNSYLKLHTVLNNTNIIKFLQQFILLDFFLINVLRILLIFCTKKQPLEIWVNLGKLLNLMN